MKDRDEFLQMLDRLKVERSLNDEEAGKLLEVGGSYLSQIRIGAKKPGPKLVKRIQYILAHPSYQLQEKSEAYSNRLSALQTTPVAEDLAQEYAARVGLEARDFIAQCVIRFGRYVVDDLEKRQVNLAAKKIDEADFPPPQSSAPN